MGILKVNNKYNHYDKLRGATSDIYTTSIMGTRLRHLSLSDVNRYVTVRKLLDSTFNILSVFIRLWEIKKYLQGNFVP
jgi:hypothetical protein